MNIKQNKAKSSKMEKKRKEMRNRLWPKLDQNLLWDRHKNTGFTTIPRTMPHIFSIMDDLADKGKPISQTYFTLWCRSFDESLIEIKNPNDLAYESGYSGQRAVTTWKARMKKLVELGFIEAKESYGNEFRYILLLNPHKIIKKHYEAKLFQENKYFALCDRAQDIGADDVT